MTLLKNFATNTWLFVLVSKDPGKTRPFDMVVSRRYEFPEKLNESLKIEFIFQIYRPSLNLV